MPSVNVNGVAGRLCANVVGQDNGVEFKYALVCEAV